VDHRYVYTYLAYNTQVAMDLMGAIGLEQIKKFPIIHKNRVENKNRVEKLFNKYLPEVKSLSVLPECEPSWFGTPVRTPNNQYKVKLVKYLEDNNVQTRNPFAGLITLHAPYSYLSDREFPNAKKVLEEYFFIGANPTWTGEQFSYLEEILSKFNG
jgi:dTDP-4-amino-4,6-dideoxygalactose transaminase